MDPESNPATRALTGELLFVLLAAAPLTLVVSTGLLALFLHAVRRSMAQTAGQGGFADLPAPGAGPPVARLNVRSLTARQPPTFPGLGAALVYLAAGIAYACSLAAVYLWANEMAFVPRRFLFLALLFLWPAVPAIALVLAVTWRDWSVVALGYALALLAIILSIPGDGPGPGALLMAWGIYNLPGTLLLWLVLMRPIRAVGPLILVLIVTLVGGAVVATGWVGAEAGRIVLAAEFGRTLGLSGTAVFWIIALAGALGMGVLGWLALRLLGRLYARRRLSDQTLQIDAVFLFFAIDHSMELAFAGPLWFLSGLLAFAAYICVSRPGLALLRQQPALPPRRLLMLRVFSLGKRSSLLFERVSRLWRRWGGIDLIAGPDFARDAVAPHEFLDFLHGRLSRRFITSPADLEARFTPDRDRARFDGRHDVESFYCHEDTWRAVLLRLAGTADVVLMDLRGFGPGNQGCTFEIHALLAHVDLRRVILAVDETTDRAFLDETLRAGWAAAGHHGPNAAIPDPTVTLFPLDRAGLKARNLVRALREASPHTGSVMAENRPGESSCQSA